jgi:GNAT superfamily N-acetyltransferase
MKIEFTISPLTQDIDFLTHKINEETKSFVTATPFAFFIRDKDGSITAGANGSLIFGSIYTDQLWVHRNHRKSGYGTKLMEVIHEYGRQSKCAISTVNTMNFQAAHEFYKKLGYKVDFERSGYHKNSKMLFMWKEL